MHFKVVMDKKRKILLQYSLAGAITGYSIFHPLVMLFASLMTAKHTLPNMLNTVGIMGVILQSFPLLCCPGAFPLHYLMEL
jgi:hypothetical protein